MQFRLITVCICTLFSSLVQAQFGEPQKDSIYSAILKEQREIEVTLPDNYKQDTTHYDVWYVIDGEWITGTFTSIFKFFVAMQFAPPVIIVSVPNRYVNGFNLRDRDFTPVPSPDVDSSGGAAHFLTFFEKELMPYINRKFRTTEESGLFGASFGGVFTFYALLERPSLFRFYATGDPALHYGNQYIPKLAAQKFKTTSYSNTVLSVGGRSGFSYHDMARDQMDSLLKTVAPNGLHWHSALYENETHGSSLYKSTYDAIKYAYLGYYTRKAEVYPLSGIVLPERPVKLFIPSDNADMRYTSTGSTPTRSSAAVDDHLLVNDPSHVRVISFSPSGRYDHELPVGMITGDYLSPKKNQTGKASYLLLNLHSKMINGQMKGIVHIPRDGYYVIQLTPSEGTTLRFNDSLLIQYNPNRGSLRHAVLLPLRSGDYSIDLRHPGTKAGSPPLNFGLYYSEDGQDDWWRNPLLRN